MLLVNKANPWERYSFYRVDEVQFEEIGQVVAFEGLNLMPEYTKLVGDELQVSTDFVGSTVVNQQIKVTY